MVLAIHILFAVLGLVLTALSYVSPSAYKLKITYSMVGATLVTGTFLVLSTNSHLVSACFSGLAYLSLAGIGIYFSRLKLQKQNK